jgi:20S proteasome alpha/beta subunit
MSAAVARDVAAGATGISADWQAMLTTAKLVTVTSRRTHLDRNVPASKLLMSKIPFAGFFPRI